MLAWALLPRRGLLPLPALARLSSVHRLLRALPVLPALTRLLVALGLLLPRPTLARLSVLAVRRASVAGPAPS